MGFSLDADPQFFSLDPSNAGAQPGDDDLFGINPALDQQTSAIAAISQALNVPLPQAAQIYAQSQPAQGQAGQSGPLVPMAAASPAGGSPATAIPSPLPPDPNAANAAPAYVPGQPMVPMASGAQAASGSGASSIPAALPFDPNLGISPAISGTDYAAQPGSAQSASMPLGQVPPSIQANAMQGNAAASPQAAPPANPNALPKHNNTMLQVLGTLSALMGGPGARIGGQIMANQAQTDQQAQQRQQQASQQQFLNQTAQSEAESAFVKQLSALDDASQEQAVRNLTPAQMAATGMTPDQVKAQFFGPDGKFIPVGSDDSKQAPQLARAQTAARTALYQLSPADQLAQHDAYQDHPDLWTQQTGLPYDGFTPGSTIKSLQDAMKIGQGDTRLAQGNRKLDQGDTRLAQQLTGEQIAFNKSMLSMTEADQQNMHDSFAGNQTLWTQKTGLPFAGWTPAMTQANATTATSVANKETDAQRADATKITLDKLNLAARAQIDQANNAVTRRGQDLRNQQSQQAVRQRAQEFNLRYGKQNAPNVEKQYQGIMNERLKVMNEMTKLSTPGKDWKGDPTLSPRDAGRIDADGNAIPNAPATPAYTEYMQLMQYDQQLSQKQAALRQPAGPAQPTVAPAMALPPGGGPMPPAAVAVPHNLSRAPRASLGAFPAPLPFVGNNPLALPPLGAGLGPTAQDMNALLSPHLSPRAFNGGDKFTLRPANAGAAIKFTVPRSRQEFAAMSPAQKQAYHAMLRQKGMAH